MSHLKRIAAPRTWPLKRKENMFILRQNPGPHNLETSMPIGFILKNMLDKTKTSRETKKVVHDENLLVNGVARKDVRFPVGLLDVISIPKTGENFTLLYSRKGKFMLAKISQDHVDERVCKIRNKTILKKNRVQLNLYDGTNMIVDKNDYKPGDSVMISKGKIKKHLKLQKGALVYLTGGQHIGETAVLEEINVSEGITPNKIILKSGDNRIETIQDYAYVIDKEFKK